MDIATLTAESFEPLVGQSVTAATPQGPLALRLDKVVPHPGQAGVGSARRAGFTLTLVGPCAPVLDQGSWELAFPGLGTAAHFAQDAEATRYEIILN
jgi:hypothetical protein